MQLTYKVVEKLADGQFHSGEALASELGVTRAAVWKAVKSAQKELALEVHCIRGRGYRLGEPLELLSQREILRGLGDAHPLAALEVHFALDSTNNYLLSKAKTHAHPRAVFTEHQTAGRGRRGRTWVSPLSGNLYFSLSWSSALAPASLSGLSLAVGVALCEALRHDMNGSPQLKWPNDIVVGPRKLGGILVDLIAEAQGPTLCIIGVGLNVHLPQPLGSTIDQPWIDLRSLYCKSVSRNVLAAKLLKGLLDNLARFEREGMNAFTERWATFDLCRDRMVTLNTPQAKVEGKAVGIDQDGALLIERNGKVERHHSGEVSLRLKTANRSE